PDHARSLITGACGAFAFKGLAAGNYRVGASEIATPVEVAIAQRSVTDLTIVADAVGDIVVHVRTPDGRPAAELNVSATASNGRPSNLPEDLGDGTYRLAALSQGK